MDELDEVIVICGAVLCCYLLTRARTQFRKRRAFKTRLINRGRRNLGFFKAYFLPMKRNDPNQFFKYTRLSVASFHKLLRMVYPIINKRSISDRITPEERLAIILHYFSQGTSMQTIAWKYHMGHSTVHYIIKETAAAIWEVLHPVYLKPPSSSNDWLKIAQEFEGMWNFPNCVGALDGKHISIQAPAKSGSQFFNYKKDFSIVLLALCDANYNFTLVDIGAYGSESDGGVFKNSVFGELMDKNELHIPPPKCLPNTNILHPFTIVADAAFPLKTYIMRPYPGKNLNAGKRIFNYRLSRARRVIENTFGILVNRWRLLRNMVAADVNNIDIFVKAIVCLHNFAKKEDNIVYCPTDFVDSDERLGRWRDNVNPLESVGRLAANRAAEILYSVRDTLKDYFLSAEGQVPWQNNVLNDGFQMYI